MSQISPASSESELPNLRAQIDRIDDQLIALLKERTGVVRQVGALKHREQPGRCPIRPGREAEQLRRVTSAFVGTGFAPAAAASIWRAVIMASLAVEGEIRLSVYAPDNQPELYWLAREYFGGFMPVTRQANPRRVISDLLEEKAQVGVLPTLSGDERLRWWPELLSLSAGKEERPHVFAHLPFAYPAKPGREAVGALAVGLVAPEPTGDDVTLLVIEADESTSMQKVQGAFAQGKLQATGIEVATVWPPHRHHVIEVRGFVTAEDPALQAAAKSLGASLVRMEILGAYAAPVVLEG